MERHNHLPSKTAIATLVGGVALFDFLCPPGETISEQVDRIRSTKIGNVATHALVWTVAGHLSGVIPDKYDWLHQLTKLKGVLSPLEQNT